MAQYLIRKIKDSTGHTFTEVIKLRENERYEIVSAESKEEAREIAEHRSKYWHPVVQTGRCSPKPEFDGESGDKEISRKDIERAMFKKKG